MTAQRLSKPVEGKKNYHVRCTGPAAETVQEHTEEKEIELFGSCFCPFVHRAWIALEESGLPYKYYEVDPYAKPQDLLDVSPKGLVPALKLFEYNPPRALNESSVIIEYCEDLAAARGKKTLLPKDPCARFPVFRFETQVQKVQRALVRLQCDHINRNLIPAFYRFLQAQESEKQVEGRKEFTEAIEKLCEMFAKAQEQGLESGLYVSDQIGMADVMAAPWLFRSTNVLRHYRNFELPENTKVRDYISKLCKHPHVVATSSTEELYLDSYARYAENRPHTSQVANAVNSGRGLP